MKTWIALPLLVSSILLAGCGGSDSGGSSGGDTGGGTTGGLQSGNMSVKLSGAVSLLANDQTVQAAKPTLNAKTGRSLFTYQVVNQGLTQDQAKARHKAGPVMAGATADGTSTGGTNLLKIDANGNASLAIQSDLPIKVMYSVADPKGEYVYLALDSGMFGTWDGNDYSQFIAANNCAFYRAKIGEDDNFSCVKEGVAVQAMDDQYFQRISGNQKPIQFDAAGNVYFAGTEFTTSCDDWNNDGTPDSCWMDSPSWNPRIFRYDPATGNTDAITQDSDSVEFFVALSDGNLVFRSWNQTTGDASLKMWRSNNSITTLNDSAWGVDFFTVDTSKTVMWGGWSDSNAGIRFARPRAAGGIVKASLDTSLFQQGGNSGWTSPTPRRVIVGDDGRLYGVFEGGRDSYDANGNWTWTSTLTVYQILPYDGVPKAELTLGQNDWWSWMSDTTFQVAKGYLYYTQQVEVPGYGTSDVIRMVRLSDRTETSLFERTTADIDNGASYYDIYSWRLSGDVLYFSALDQSTNTVVNGEIDTIGVKNGAAVSDFLKVTEVASALGAAAKVQDIEVLKPQQSTYESNIPTVDQFYVNPENLYSASIDFTKYMDHDSVEQKLVFQDVTGGANTDVEYIPVWIYKSLHLIPDTDGLLSQTLTTVPLATGHDYTITVPANTLDASGFVTAADESVPLHTRPDYGWYLGDTDSTVSAISGGQAAKFAGMDPANSSWYMESYNLGVNAAGPVRIEFSAKNLGWSGINVLLWNVTNYTGTGYAWDAAEANLHLSSWSSLDYRTGTGSDYVSGDTSSLFNGTWERYRIDLYGTNLVVSVSEDGVNYTQVMAQTNLRDRSLTTAETQYVLLRVQEAVMLDDIKVSTLDSSGNLAVAGGGDLLDEDFSNLALSTDLAPATTPNYIGFEAGDAVEADTTNYSGLDSLW